MEPDVKPDGRVPRNIMKFLFKMFILPYLYTFNLYPYSQFIYHEGMIVVQTLKPSRLRIYQYNEDDFWFQLGLYQAFKQHWYT